MPSTAPALTWQMTNLRIPANPTAVQDVLDAIALAIGDSTTWEVKSSAPGELEIGPLAGSATPNIRLLIAFGINAAQRQEPHDGAAVDANELWMGIAPDGGTLGDAHGAGDPYGAARWSLYWRISSTINTNFINRLFVLTSDEVASIWLQKDNTEDWWGGGGGAFIDPPTDADGEGTPGRVFGMFVSGRDLISSNFWAGASDLFNSGVGSLDPVVGCFRPALPARWSILDRSLSVGEVQPKFATEAGTRMSIPVMMFQAGVTTLGTPGGVNPTNGVGVLRQIRRAEDGSMRGMVLDSANAPQSYFVSSTSTGSSDAASFDNG
jgi:hypothetical protein